MLSRDNLLSIPPFIYQYATRGVSGSPELSVGPSQNLR